MPPLPVFIIEELPSPQRLLLVACTADTSLNRVELTCGQCSKHHATLVDPSAHAQRHPPNTGGHAPSDHLEHTTGTLGLSEAPCQGSMHVPARAPLSHARAGGRSSPSDNDG
jgi:hypothetical protein